MDLAASAPYEDIGTDVNVGVVHVLRGTRWGLAMENQVWHQGISGVQGSPEEYDLFGYSLAAIPFSSKIFADGFETGDTDRWSDTVH